MSPCTLSTASTPLQEECGMKSVVNVAGIMAEMSSATVLQGFEQAKT